MSFFFGNQCPREGGGCSKPQLELDPCEDDVTYNYPPSELIPAAIKESSLCDGSITDITKIIMPLPEQYALNIETWKTFNIKGSPQPINIGIPGFGSAVAAHYRISDKGVKHYAFRLLHPFDAQKTVSDFQYFDIPLSYICPDGLETTLVAEVKYVVYYYIPQSKDYVLLSDDDTYQNINLNELNNIKDPDISLAFNYLSRQYPEHRTQQFRMKESAQDVYSVFGGRGVTLKTNKDLKYKGETKDNVEELLFEKYKQNKTLQLVPENQSNKGTSSSSFDTTGDGSEFDTEEFVDTADAGKNINSIQSHLLKSIGSEIHEIEEDHYLRSFNDFDQHIDSQVDSDWLEVEEKDHEGNPYIYKIPPNTLSHFEWQRPETYKGNWTKRILPSYASSDISVDDHPNPEIAQQFYVMKKYKDNISKSIGSKMNASNSKTRVQGTKRNTSKYAYNGTSRRGADLFSSDYDQAFFD